MTMNAMPNTATGMPSHAGPKKASAAEGGATPNAVTHSGGSCMNATNSVIRIRLDPVPIMVPWPPRMAEKLNGMNSLEGEIRSRFAQSLTMGRYMATMGVVFMNADMPATGTIIRIWAIPSDVGRPSSLRPISSIPPVSLRPAATTYRPAIISNA